MQNETIGIYFNYSKTETHSSLLFIRKKYSDLITVYTCTQFLGFPSILHNFETLKNVFIYRISDINAHSFPQKLSFVLQKTIIFSQSTLAK